MIVVKIFSANTNVVEASILELRTRELENRVNRWVREKKDQNPQLSWFLASNALICVAQCEAEN